MVRRGSSDLPFYGEVFGQDIRRTTQLEAKKCAGGGVVELTTIVTLDDFDGAAKLRENKGEKLDKVENVSDFTRKVKVHIK
jgi:hypothetical protein